MHRRPRTGRHEEEDHVDCLSISVHRQYWVVGRTESLTKADIHVESSANLTFDHHPPRSEFSSFLSPFKSTLNRISNCELHLCQSSVL